MDTIVQLNQCLNQSANINIDTKGNFHTMNCIEVFFGRLIEWLFGIVGDRELKVEKAFRNAVKNLEKEKITQEEGKIRSVINLKMVHQIHKKLKANRADFKREEFGLSTKKSIRVLRSLDARHGIRYQDEKIKVDEKNQLIELAKNWKVKQAYRDEDGLTDQDLEILEQICIDYPDMVRDVLVAEPKYQSRFFKWHIRDKADHHLFFQFSRLRRSLSESCIERKISRIEKLDRTTVSWQKNSKGKLEKVVLLKIEGKDYDIKNPNKLIHLSAKIQLTANDIFDRFKKMMTQFGQMDIFQDEGIIHWRTEDFSRLNLETNEWKQVDLSSNKFYKELPIYKTYTFEELRQLTGDQFIKGSHGVFVKANRAERSLNPLENHSWMEYIIYDKDTDVYLSIPRGKYIKHYPESVVEKLISIGSTSPAIKSFPDIAEGLTHRQICYKFYPLDQTELDCCLKEERMAIQRIHNGTEYFQLPTQNCSDDILAVLGKAVPSIRSELEDAFIIDFDSVEPTGVLGGIHTVFQKVRHDDTRRFLYQALFWLTGGRSGIDKSDEGGPVVKGVNEHPLLKEGQIYLPAKLFNIVHAQA